ncbi:hypothetical protein ACFLVG_03540 [Chloroflexota bacterium]
MLSDTTLKDYDSLFIPLNLKSFRYGRDKPRVCGKIISIEPYISALMGASGINRLQAKICFYYAVATHLLPEKLDIMTILAIIGALGTGKSKLLAQLRKMVKQPKLIGAESQSTLRDELDGTVTALIDEGDKVYEPYLQRRYAKETSQISYKQETGDIGWRKVEADIFGGTIIVRRTPFADQATKSRSIVIATKYKPGSYEVIDIDMEDIMRIAHAASLALTSSERIKDNWLPLQAIATSLEDREWLEFSEKQIKKDIQAMMASQDFEPEEAILSALKEQMLDTAGGICVATDVSISELKGVLKYHYDLKLKSFQIKEICSGLGFKVVTTSNYPKVRANKELLEKLLAEKEVKSEDFS